MISLAAAEKPREERLHGVRDSDLRPHPDQWSSLASIEPDVAVRHRADDRTATGGVHPLDVTFIDDEDLTTPWKRDTRSLAKIPGVMPKSLTVTLRTSSTSRRRSFAAIATLIDCAAFRTRVLPGTSHAAVGVGQAPGDRLRRQLSRHIALPRGCSSAQDLLSENTIRCDLRDERNAGEPIDVRLVGTLRIDQEAAVAAMLRDDVGVLCAPTAFGKTVTVPPMIARMGREYLGAWYIEPNCSSSGRRSRLSRRRRGRGRHDRRRQGESHREGRHRGDAVAVSPR